MAAVECPECHAAINVVDGRLVVHPEQIVTARGHADGYRQCAGSRRPVKVSSTRAQIAKLPKKGMVRTTFPTAAECFVARMGGRIDTLPGDMLDRIARRLAGGHSAELFEVQWAWDRRRVEANLRALEAERFGTGAP